MENMRKMGFNTLRAWLVWNACEKAEGEIDYEYITGFLDCAKKHDLNVGLLFHLHAAPAWAIKKYPQFFYVDEDHHPFVPGIRANTPSGGWPGLCFDHEEAREAKETLWGLFSPKPRTRVIDPGPGSGTGLDFLQTVSRCYLGKRCLHPRKQKERQRRE